MRFFPTKKQIGNEEGRDVKILRTGNPTARPVLVRVWAMIGCFVITLAFIALIIVIQKRLPDGSKSTFHPTWKRDAESRFLFARQGNSENVTSVPEIDFETATPTQVLTTDAPTFTLEPVNDCLMVPTETIVCTGKGPQGCFTTSILPSCASAGASINTELESTPLPTSLAPIPEGCLIKTIYCPDQSSCYNTYYEGPCTSTTSETITVQSDIPTSSAILTTSTTLTKEATSTSIVITTRPSSVSSTTLATCYSETLICPSESSCYDALVPVPCTSSTLDLPTRSSNTITAPPDLTSSTLLAISTPTSQVSSTLTRCSSETLICPSDSSCYFATVPCTTITSSTQASSTTEICVSETLLCPSDSSCYYATVLCTSTTLDSSSSTTNSLPPSTITSIIGTESCIVALEECYTDYTSSITICETDFLTLTGTDCVTEPSTSVLTPTNTFSSSTSEMSSSILVTPTATITSLTITQLSISMTTPITSAPYCMTEEVYCFEDEIDTEEGEQLVTICQTSYMTISGTDCGPISTSSLDLTSTLGTSYFPISSTSSQLTPAPSSVPVSVDDCFSTDISCNTYYRNASLGALIAGIGGFASVTETLEPITDCTTIYTSVASYCLSVSTNASTVSTPDLTTSSTQSSDAISSTSNPLVRQSSTSSILIPSSTPSTPAVLTSGPVTSISAVSTITSSTAIPLSSISLDGSSSSTISIISSLSSLSVSAAASTDSGTINQSSKTKLLVNLVLVESSISVVTSLSKTSQPATIRSSSSADWFFSPPIVSPSATKTISSMISSTRDSKSLSTNQNSSINVQEESMLSEHSQSSSWSTKSTSTGSKSSTVHKSTASNSYFSSHKSSPNSKTTASISTILKSAVSKSTVSKYTASISSISKSLSIANAESQVSLTNIATTTFGSINPTTSATTPTNNATDLPVNLSPGIFPISKVVIGNYVPLVAARVFTSVLTPFYNTILLFEPIRQLTNLNGAPYAALAGSSGIETPINIAMLIANLGSGFAAGATFLDNSYCALPPCTPRLSANPWGMDIIIATLAIQALAIAFLISQWWRKPSHLAVDPTSIAGVAVVMGHPKIEADFQSIPAETTASELKTRMGGERYKLGTFMTATGVIKFGIMPAPVDPNRKPRGSGFFARIKDSIPFIDNWRNNRLYFDTFFLMFLLALLGLTCAALSQINKTEVVFLATAAASGTGLRIFLAVLGTIVSTYWGKLFRDMQTFTPYIDLGRGDANPDPTVLLHKHSFPLTAFFPLLHKRHYVAASVAFTSLLAEFLILALSGIPYRPGQARGEFIFWSFVSLFILIMMTVQLLVVVAWRRKLREMGRAPDTIASVMALVAGTGMVRDFDGAGLSVMGTRERDAMVRGWGKRYGYGWRREGREGRVRWVVDEKVGKGESGNVNGEGMRRVESF